MNRVGQAMSAINNMFAIQAFANRKDALALFKSPRQILDYCAQGGTLYSTAMLFLVLLLSAALIVYITGLACVILGINRGLACLITAGVLLFSIIFLIPMILSTLALCVGFVGQRTICDLIEDLAQPEAQMLVRDVIRLAKQAMVPRLSLLDDLAPRVQPVWPSGLGRNFRLFGGQKEQGGLANASVKVKVLNTLLPELNAFYQDATKTSIEYGMEDVGGQIFEVFQRVWTPETIAAILRRFSGCGNKDLSAFNLIGKDVVVELFNSVGSVVQGLESWAWLIDDSKTMPINVADKLDKALQDLKSGSLDRILPDLSSMRQKVEALNMQGIEVSDLRAKVGD
ncbi:unnamed protein product, partial [Ixodes hexagonus]